MFVWCFIISSNEKSPDENNKFNFLNDAILMVDEIEAKYLKKILKKDFKFISEIQKEYVEDLYSRYKNFFDINIVNDNLFGLNFVFIGFSGSYFFPAVLWYAQSYSKIKDQFKILLNIKYKNFLEFQIDFSKIILENLGTRKGYSEELLESLNFYANNYLKNHFNLNMEMSENFSLGDYKPKYFVSFSKNIFKKNFENVLSAMNQYLIPNNYIWNLGEILIDPDYILENNDNFYQIFPHWLLQKDNKTIFSLFQVSPELFRHEFEFKTQIVNSIKFFISFNSFEKYQGNLYQFKLPDLDKLFEIFNDQNFQLKNNQSNTQEELSGPDWSQIIKIPKKLNNSRKLLNREENEYANNFLFENLDIVIYSYNNYKNSQFIKIQDIMKYFYRKNIFYNLFFNRFRLDKSNLNSILVIWIKLNHRKNLNYKNYLIDFFSTVFVTGIIVEYELGLMFYLSINSLVKKNGLSKIQEFLKIFSFDFEIFTGITNHGFHLYSFPPSNYFVQNKWIFPSINLNVNPNDFKKIPSFISENERIKLDNNVFKERIINFSEFLEKF